MGFQRPLHLRRFTDESGQAMVLFATALVVLLGMSAFVIDIRRAYFVQRSLQANADAAATAGALELPDAGLATTIAQQYSGSDGQKECARQHPGSHDHGHDEMSLDRSV